MKYKLLLFLFIIPFIANAQKSSYVKSRLTFDLSYTRMNYRMMPEQIEKKNGILLSANYGITKFLETGLYYYIYKPKLITINFLGIQNRFHILPFFVGSNNKYFRLDAYVFNQTGLNIEKISDNNYSYLYNSDIGIGTSLYLFKHMGINFEYKWSFYLSKQIANRNFQNGFAIGLCFKI